MTTTRQLRVVDLSYHEFSERLGSAGLGVEIGPFSGRLCVRVERLHETLFQLYRYYPVLAGDGVFSFHPVLEELPRRLWGSKRRVRFSIDGRVPHEDMPLAHALPVLEWGVNLVIALRSHSMLMLHSAVVARGDYALIMPAAPGSGKSTLCAALVHRGWRLFSDEFGLIRSGTDSVIPVPRPVALKNESIGVFRSFAPDAHIGPVSAKTRKGDVAHVRPPEDSIRQQARVATPKWIIFPQWQSGSRLTLEAVPKADAFMLLAMNAFNYELLGESAFLSVKQIIDSSACYKLCYSDLDEAVRELDAICEINNVDS